MYSTSSVLERFFDRVCAAQSQRIHCLSCECLWPQTQLLCFVYAFISLHFVSFPFEGEYDLVLSRLQEAADTGREQSAAQRAEFERLLHVRRQLASSRLPRLQNESLDALARRRVDEACDESMRLAYRSDVLHLTVSLPKFTSANNNEVAIVYYEPGVPAAQDAFAYIQGS